MKKYFSLILAIILTMTLVSCKKKIKEVDYHISGICFAMEDDDVSVDFFSEDPYIIYSHKTDELKTSKGIYPLNFENITKQKDGNMITITLTCVFGKYANKKVKLYRVLESLDGVNYIDKTNVKTINAQDARTYTIKESYKISNQDYQFNLTLHYKEEGK